MKQSCPMYISSLHYNREGLRKVAVCIYHPFIITRKDEAKLRYVYIITSLQQERMNKKLRYVYIITSLQEGRIKKICGMYISSLHYNKEG